MPTTSSTLTTADAVCGPVDVEDYASALVAITGTITVVPDFSHDRVTWVEQTSLAMTASGSLQLNGPGVWRLRAKTVSGGSAACSIMT
jgi:hypothetical protein